MAFRFRPLMALPPLLFAAFAGVAYMGLKRENAEELPSALIGREAQAGDRVLLPRAWEAGLPPGLHDALRSKGASLVCVERIGII